MTLHQQLAYAEYRWLEAERNGTHYDAVYWRGRMDGLKVKLGKLKYRHVMEDLVTKMKEST